MGGFALAMLEKPDSTSPSNVASPRWSAHRRLRAFRRAHADEAENRGVPRRHQRAGDGHLALSGQAAEEVEKQVTIPVERALFGVPNVLVQRSITSFGLSQVIVTFEDGVDIYFARQQVAERLPSAEVPDGVTPTLGPNDTPVGQVYQYTLESDHHSPE